MEKEYSIAIDASRNRSGGAIIHTMSILKYFNPSKYQIKTIHLWAYEELLGKIPDYPWLVKHCPIALSGNIFQQLFWQRFEFKKEILASNCSLLFSLGAGSVCRFKPYVTMSRDMLSFDKKEFHRYFFSKSWLRLFILKYGQLSSFKNSNATIFLTDYAKSRISDYQEVDYETVIINHGVSDAFRIDKKNKSTLINESEIVITYVSNADLYKHNWNLIKAVSIMRKRYNLNLKLQLIGAKDGNKKAIELIENALGKCDNGSQFVFVTPKISHTELIAYLEKSDILVFASTCENMPNTLIEGMSSGIPLVCSSYGPMPEIIKDAAIYFDPENTDSLILALYKVITNDKLRLDNAVKSKELSMNFSWEKCSNETFSFINKKLAKGFDNSKSKI